ncbi:MAG: BrnA antitoxin family protein [Xanthobacteraceae bacterium]
MADDRRRPTSTRDTAEAAFKKATSKPVDLPPPRPAIPLAKEMVSLRLDRDVLDHFQAGGPGWQDRINDALRKLIDK